MSDLCRLMAALHTIQTLKLEPPDLFRQRIGIVSWVLAWSNTLAIWMASEFLRLLCLELMVQRRTPFNRRQIVPVGLVV